MTSSELKRRSLLAALIVGALAGCTGKTPPAPQAAINALEIVELKPGAGRAIAAGQTAVVQYTGWLFEASAPDKKGRQFDSSLNSGQPFRFGLGAGQVIKGWDQGILGMAVGGRRRLVIPADLAYGDSGAGVNVSGVGRGASSP